MGLLHAQVGSIYEYFNKNPIFGLLPPGNPLYAPILGFFAITGLPLSGAADMQLPALCSRDLSSLNVQASSSSRLSTLPTVTRTGKTERTATTDGCLGCVDQCEDRPVLRFCVAWTDKRLREEQVPSRCLSFKHAQARPQYSAQSHPAPV